MWKRSTGSLGVQRLWGNVNLVLPGEGSKVFIDLELFEELNVLESGKDPASVEIPGKIYNTAFAVIEP